MSDCALIIKRSIYASPSFLPSFLRTFQAVRDGLENVCHASTYRCESDARDDGDEEKDQGVFHKTLSLFVAPQLVEPEHQLAQPFAPLVDSYSRGRSSLSPTRVLSLTRRAQQAAVV